MKKLIIGSFFASLLLAGCAKDYNCKCTYTNVDDPTDTYTSDNDLRNTKKEAQKNCDYLSGGESYSGSLTYSVSCELLAK